VLLVCAVSCGGGGTSNDQVAKIESAVSGAPETGMAQPGYEGDSSTQPDSLQVPVNVNPLGVPQATPAQPGSAAGITIPGTEHFIASAIYQDTGQQVGTTIGFLDLTLQRNPTSTLFDPQSEIFSIEISGDANWIAIPSYCEPVFATVQAKKINCSMENYYQAYPSFLGQGLISLVPARVFQYQPNSAGIVDFTIVYPAGELPEGTYPAVATVEKFSDPHTLSREVSLVADEVPETIDMVPTTVGFGLETDLYQPEFSTSLTIEVSPDLIVDDWSVAQVFGERDYSHLCVFAENLHCELSELSGEYGLAVSLMIRIPYGANHQIIASVPQQVGERDISDNILTINLAASYSSDELQQLIDLATNGDVLQFPAGIYSGRLDGKGKNLSILGATDNDSSGVSALTPSEDRLPTVIQLETRKYTETFSPQYGSTFQSIRQINYEPLLTNFGDETQISGIEFRTRGQSILGDSGKFISLSNNIIKPVPERSHDMDTLGTMIDHACWVQNRIEGWGAGENNLCETLIDGLSNGTAGATHLLGNVFLNNNCQAGLISSDHKDHIPDSYSGIAISNNTFINNPLILSVSGSSGSRDIDFRNNLIFGSSLLGSYNDIGVNAALVSSSNLVWNSVADDLFGVEFLEPERIIRHAPNLNLNPMFKDPDNGDFGLSSGSPAIDSGTESAEFDPAAVLNTIARSENCHFGSFDGNQDGTAEPDIGAYEFEVTQ